MSNIFSTVDGEQVVPRGIRSLRIATHGSQFCIVVLEAFTVSNSSLLQNGVVIRPHVSSVTFCLFSKSTIPSVMYSYYFDTFYSLLFL